MNVKRMEVMLEDLSENFDRHVSTTSQSYYFVMTAKDYESKLRIKVYSQGADVELEILAFAVGDCSPTFEISVDGEVVGHRAGAITIENVHLARGWRILEIDGKNLSSGRVRIKGSISGVSLYEN